MIISASRRTDIPCFYTEWFINRMKEGYALSQNPMNPAQISRIPFDPELADCIVFWTKDPHPMLAALPQWTDEAIHDGLIALAEQLGVKNATLMWPVRIAAAGKLVTPGGAVEICRILGRDETLRRLRAGLEKLA